MGAVDVAHKIVAASRMDCVRCSYESQLGEFGRFVADRAGLKIVDCKCPACGERWKRIEVGVLQ